jgi:hypothetical protein
LPYASNEEEEITNFYMGQAARTHCPDFETFLLVSNAQDEIPYEPEWLEGLFLQQAVVVEGQVAMRVFGREDRGEAVVITPDNQAKWLTPEQVRPPLFRGQIPVEVNLADQVVLAGYEISSTAVSPGERLTVRLYWEVLAPFDANKQIFTHLTDGRVQAQHDSAPECAVNPTTRWEPGQIIVDPHIIEMPADTPPGPGFGDAREQGHGERRREQGAPRPARAGARVVGPRGGGDAVAVVGVVVERIVRRVVVLHVETGGIGSWCKARRRVATGSSVRLPAPGAA